MLCQKFSNQAASFTFVEFFTAVPGTFQHVQRDRQAGLRVDLVNPLRLVEQHGFVV